MLWTSRQPGEVSEPVARAEGLWLQCVGVLRNEFPESVWNTWFESLRPSALDGHRLVLSVASPVAKERIESRYLELMQDVISDVTGEPHEVVLEVRTDPSSADDPGGDTDTVDEPPIRGRLLPPGDRPPGGRPGTPEVAPEIDLNPAYTFDDFVIGGSNGFACAAALSVAETPAKSYNPLFIYGGTGLGKTHLLHAIGHYVRQTYPDQRVRYVSTETFLNDFIDAIRTNAQSAFKNRYRQCDVLLVDDVQLIENKERFQEEFFHTFDFLHSAGRQIVISSDRPPKAIATLEERLRSRFSMGLITDIHPPDVETRVAILRKKADAEPTAVPPEVLVYIAECITDNIRQLEGALNRVLAYASLNRVPLTLSLAEGVLDDLISANEPRQVTPQIVLEATAEMFGFTVADLVSKSRSRPLVTARQIAMYVLRQMTNFSYPAIGRQFGDRDHTTVMHAVTKITALMRERRPIYDQVHELMNRIRAGG
ncbi:MAG: chromosomal replication initiator protein DnaA [Actinomycetota bacterium]|nr:chromosomal replication initiator protein DnaA [Actinomycetota bacterium]